MTPGMKSIYPKRLRELLPDVSQDNDVLDIACGPNSLLWMIDLDPMGIDLSQNYVTRFHEKRKKAVLGSAVHLPVAGEQFDYVCTFGLFHHLPDEDVRKAVAEMIRVCRKGGQIIIVDAVYPVTPLFRPIAYFLRKIDRGRYMRDQDQLDALMPGDLTWKHIRRSYTYFGHELFALIAIKQ